MKKVTTAELKKAVKNNIKRNYYFEQNVRQNKEVGYDSKGISATSKG